MKISPLIMEIHHGSSTMAMVHGALWMDHAMDHDSWSIMDGSCHGPWFMNHVMEHGFIAC